jgi:prevent-host-death family protein
MTTRVVNTHEAKSRLSELIRAAEEGIEVIIARNGQPVARIVPWQPARPKRVPGAWAGRVHYGDDLVGPDDDVLEAFDESADAPLP